MNRFTNTWNLSTAIADYCDEWENACLIKSLPAFDLAHQEHQKFRDWIFSVSTSSEAALQQSLAKQTTRLASALLAYAMQEGNQELESEVNYQEKDFGEDVVFTECVLRVEQVLTKAKARRDYLGTYGVGSAQLEELEFTLGAFAAATGCKGTSRLHFLADLFLQLERQLQIMYLLLGQMTRRDHLFVECFPRLDVMVKCMPGVSCGRFVPEEGAGVREYMVERQAGSIRGEGLDMILPQ